MEIRVQPGDVVQSGADLAVLAVFEDRGLPDGVAGLVEAGDFKGKSEECLLLYPRAEGLPRRLLLVGLGKADDLKPETLRRVGAIALKQARTLQTASFAIGLADSSALTESLAQALAEGAVLGSYRFWKHRTGLSDEQKFVVQSATLYTGDADAAAIGRGVEVGKIVAYGVEKARSLVNAPGQDLSPAGLAETARKLGERVGLNVTVYDENQLKEQGFGGIMAVGQGSYNPPRFIVMEYGAAGDDKPTICLVGKGITFDSGGLSIKPADAMETMKNDMGGAAAVLGAMQVVAELKLPLHVVGLIASAENMPSGRSFRPGDILTTLSGKTIEVLNTDAEGRIVLSDALHYAQRYNPAAIVELSTLTGAIIIALGAHATGMMATDQSLADRISRAGEESGERVWQLPLWKEYHEMIKSEYADVKNIGGRPAGSITAGAFLATFTGDFPFVHLDIAGTGWTENPSRSYESKGGTGVGVRLLTQFLRDYSN